MTGSSARPRSWCWRVRATVTGEAHQLLALVERLEKLGYSAQITAARGSWEMDLRTAFPPTPDLLRQTVSLIRREFPGTATSSLVLEAGDGRYRLRPSSIGLPLGGSDP